jgi:hypothetical protein
MEPWRIYRLCKITHCPMPPLDELPGGLCEWLLAIDDIYEERDARRARQAREGR